MKKYPEEIRRKAISLIKSGTPKREASRIVGVPYHTIIDWTPDIRLRKTYPKLVKIRVRRLVRKGLSKSEVSRITRLPYYTVLYFTIDIKARSKNTEKVTGMTLKLLRELVARGYVFDDKNPANRGGYKTLRKYFPVKTTKLNRIRVFYLDGSERKAMEALMKRIDLHSISYHDLGYMRKAFGIKNMKRNNKIREIDSGMTKIKKFKNHKELLDYELELDKKVLIEIGLAGYNPTKKEIKEIVKIVEERKKKGLNPEPTAKILNEIRKKTRID